MRIAILDTGVDARHPEIRAALKEKRIVRYFPDSANAISDPELLDPLADRHGHGTHGTSVLLRAAPNAAIYIARVADDNGKLRYDGIPEVFLFSRPH